MWQFLYDILKNINFVGGFIMHKIRKKWGSIAALLSALAVLVAIISGQSLDAKTKIKLNKTSISMEIGQTKQLKLTGTKKKVTWKSSADKIAAVNKNGKVTAKKAGKATITAKCNKKNYNCKVTVKDHSVTRNGKYDGKKDVQEYLTKYYCLPSNYITKAAARELGWSGGGLDAYQYGACIGGDYFGNYEGNLPKKEGRSYYECDIDTMHKDSRGAKRIVYSNDGLIYYTEDHYQTFELLAQVEATLEGNK